MQQENLKQHLLSYNIMMLNIRNILREKNFKGPPEKEDWNRARVFVKFLKMFYDVTLKFLGSLHVTSNFFF